MRRLDWRFLLPDPMLGDVAYIGRTDTTLFAALREFAGSIAVIDARDLSRRERGRSHDLLVLAAPTIGVLSASSEFVRRAGHLYAEIPRWPGSVRRMVPHHPASYAAALRAVQFTEVSLYWHWRDFDACTAIVPLDEPDAFVHWTAKHAIGTPVAATIARQLLRAGIVGWAVPSLSVVARKQANS